MDISNLSITHVIAIMKIYLNVFIYSISVTKSIHLTTYAYENFSSEISFILKNNTYGPVMNVQC